jgi:hypothetical protein
MPAPRPSCKGSASSQKRLDPLFQTAALTLGVRRGDHRLGEIGLERDDDAV